MQSLSEEERAGCVCERESEKRNGGGKELSDRKKERWRGGERQGQESRNNNVEGDIEKQKRWTESKSKCMFQKRRRDTLIRRVR